MKPTTTGAASGCIVWVILIGLLSSCLLPTAFMLGGLTSSSDTAIRTTGQWVCPAETTPESYSYATTMTDDNGISHPATAYELHCVDAGGQVVKEDPIVYSFLWIGIFAAAASLLAVLLSLALAAPAGVLIGRLLKRRSTTAAPASHQDRNGFPQS